MKPSELSKKGTNNLASRPWRRGSLKVVGLALFACLACRLVATFDVQQSGQVKLPSGQTPEELSFDGLLHIDLANHPTLKSQGLDLGDISAATLQNITLAVTDPATGVDLSFIKAVSIVASADHLPSLTLASLTDPKAGSNLAQFVVEPNQSLTSYAKAQNFSLIGHAQYAKAPDEDLELTLTGSLRLTIGEPGAACTN